MNKTAIIILLFFSGLSKLVYGQSISAKEVMQKNDLQRIGNKEYSKLSMTLINKQGGKRERQLDIKLFKDKDNNLSQIIKFHSPSDIKGTAFLSIEHHDKSDDQWMYLPAFKKTRRISSSFEKGYFAGSDFTFEDLNREDFLEYDYKLLSTVKVNGTPCYHIEATPLSSNKKKNSGYSKREIFIEKKDYIMVKSIYYDKKGEKIKVFTASNIKKVPGSDVTRSYTIEMNNIKSNRKTILNYLKIETGCCVEANDFSLRYLTQQ